MDGNVCLLGGGTDVVLDMAVGPRALLMQRLREKGGQDYLLRCSQRDSR